MFERRQIIASDGARLNYKIAGPGPATLMLCPGWASSQDYFDAMFEELDATGLRILVFAPRGQGSTAVDLDHSCERQSADLAEIAAHEGIERCVAAGHSMGGKIVQHLAIAQPGLVDGLILFASAPAGPVACDDADIEASARAIGDPAGLDQAYAAAVTCPVAPDIEAKWKREAAAMLFNDLRLNLRHCFRDDFSAAFRAGDVSIPALIIGGTEDPVFSRDVMQSIAATISGSRVVLLVCGHEIPSELPAPAARLVAGFLSGTDR
jgi:pimeloyl-ACP methyl ester carboxylesterase